MLKYLTILTLLIVLAQSNYMINVKCGYYNCPYGCSLCQVLDGGPFNQYASCVSSCSSGNTFNISFTCNGCPTSSSDCSYTTYKSGYSPNVGCTNSYDSNWQYNLKPSLDGIYAKSTSSLSTYDWCSNACSGLSTVVIVLIVVGAVAICAIIAFILNRRAKKRRAEAALMAANNIYGPIVS